MLISRREIAIEWGDCDPAEIVYYPNYFRWFDGSTAAHFAVAGLPKPELRTRFGVVGFPMVDTRARFLVPSRFGDTVTIETRIAKFGRSSFEVVHHLNRGEKLAVECFETRVLVAKDPDDPQRIKAVAVPAEVVALFAGKSG